MLSKYLMIARPLALPFAFGWSLMLMALLGGRGDSDFDYFFSTPATKFLFAALTTASLVLLIAYGILFVKWLERKAHRA